MTKNEEILLRRFEMEMNSAGLIGISRHRIGVDGEGVTTLVAFHGCPLRCRFCLNRQSWEEDGVWRRMTERELYEEVKKDDLYFRATGGGVTFGGGEPCLQAEFIGEFRELRGEGWKVNVETSLNVPTESIAQLLPVVDHWIVDIKDMNPGIYEAYTGKGNGLVLKNLAQLIHGGAKITARVPRIAGFNSTDDVERSVAELERLGITDIDIFTYKTK